MTTITVTNTRLHAARGALFNQLLLHARSAVYTVAVYDQAIDEDTLVARIELYPGLMISAWPTSSSDLPPPSPPKLALVLNASEMTLNPILCRNK